jgi:hypothetical protein
VSERAPAPAAPPVAPPPAPRALLEARRDVLTARLAGIVADLEACRADGKATALSSLHRAAMTIEDSLHAVAVDLAAPIVSGEADGAGDPGAALAVAVADSADLPPHELAALLADVVAAFVDGRSDIAPAVRVAVLRALDGVGAVDS